MPNENAHVDALVATIQGLSGTPVPACTYNFASVTNVTQYVVVAAVLENTGVSAYDGAINTIYDKGLQQTAATIATVEARHASYLNLITNGTAVGTANGVPFPLSFDVPLPPRTIVTAITPYLVSCPYNVTVPTSIVVTPSSGADRLLVATTALGIAAVAAVLAVLA